MPSHSIISRRMPVGAGLLLVAFMLWAQHTDQKAISAVRERLEFLAYDLRLNATLPDSNEKPPAVVIIDIDEASLQAEGRWPWSRTHIAELVQRLADSGVAVIAFDIMFAEAEQNPLQEIVSRIGKDDAALANALTPYTQRLDADALLAAQLANSDSVLGFVLHNQATRSDGTLPPPIAGLASDSRVIIPRMQTATGNLPALQQAARTGGFLTTLPDSDGAIRRSPMVLRYGDAIYPSLALAAAATYLLIDKPEIQLTSIGTIDAVDHIALGSQRIAVDASGRVLVPYRGPQHSFHYISATDVLHGQIDPQQLQNSIALIGASALALADLKATPVAGVFPGVEIQATLIAGALENSFPAEPAWANGANFSLMLSVGVALSFLLPFLGAGGLIAVVTAAFAAITAGNFWLWESERLALALAMPLLLIVLLTVLNMAYGFLFEARGRRQLKGMFGQYVPPALVEEMSQHPDHFGFEGDNREMSVLFADIRSFTTLSESLSARDLKALLNRFFTPMTRIIFDRRGTIDKYVGDMIMAFWGAPLHDVAHADHAVAAALDMLAAVENLKQEFAREGLPAIAVGIGVNTGPMNVGDMGSEYRRAYTVIGDAVNLASRLEGLTKYYGVGLVVGPTTRTLADQFFYRRLDRVRVKGKTEAVEVFQPICRLDAVSPALREEVSAHERALDLYWKADWNGAAQGFEDLHRQHPETRIYALYLERIAELRKRALPADWDGIYDRREK